MSDRLAPITSSIGFLRAPLDIVAAGLTAWRRDLHGDVATRPLSGSLTDLVAHLEPLTGGSAARELLVSTGSPTWTAVFDCSLTGIDADAAVRQLCLRLGRTGVAITAVPHTLGTGLETQGRYGAVQMTLYGPLTTAWLNQVRSISVAHDGTRWRFDVDGTEQDFETPSAYTRRRVRDRFTADMLAEYCAALGIEPFDEAFYGPSAVLLTSDAPTAPDGKVLRLAEAQAWFGIRPGANEQVRG
jgi:hypothetical protein